MSYDPLDCSQILAESPLVLIKTCKKQQAKGDDDAEQPMQETLQSGSSMICEDKVDHEVKCPVTL